MRLRVIAVGTAAALLLPLTGCQLVEAPSAQDEVGASEDPRTVDCRNVQRAHTKAQRAFEDGVWITVNGRRGVMSGEGGYEYSFERDATTFWPNTQDPDLKDALRELSKGNDWGANWRAILSMCNIPIPTG